MEAPKLVAVTRRERLRAQTLAELKQHAHAQVAEGALSTQRDRPLMGLSGPALYRYFASRDELLAALVFDSYDDLADTLQDTARPRPRGTPSRVGRRLSRMGARSSAPLPARLLHHLRLRTPG